MFFPSFCDVLWTCYSENFIYFFFWAWFFFQCIWFFLHFKTAKENKGLIKLPFREEKTYIWNVSPLVGSKGTFCTMHKNTEAPPATFIKIARKKTRENRDTRSSVYKPKFMNPSIPFVYPNLYQIVSWVRRVKLL